MKWQFAHQIKKYKKTEVEVDCNEVLTDIRELDLDVGFDLFANSAGNDEDDLEAKNEEGEGQQSPAKKMKLDPDLLEPKVEIKETANRETEDRPVNNGSQKGRNR